MFINKAFPCHISNYKEASRSIGEIKYIVVHYTANKSSVNGARSNAQYFCGSNRKASAHYFCDNISIYQSVQEKDIAWHCGGTYTYKHPECRNSNSIGVELCSDYVNGEYIIKESVEALGIELIVNLMRKYNISLNNVIRHYDVWDKCCPAPYVNHPELWVRFKDRLKRAYEDYSLGVKEEDLSMGYYEELKQKDTKQDEIINLIGSEIQALKTDVDLLKNKPIYNYIDENMPSWAVETVKKIKDKGLINGGSDGCLSLTNEMLRTLVLLDRAGCFGE